MTNWSTIGAGYYHTVAIRSNGTLWGWGYNGHGQLGDGTTTDRTSPTQEWTGSTDWSAIAGGTEHTVALKSVSALATPIPATTDWGLAALGTALLVMTTWTLRRSPYRLAPPRT